MADGTLMIDRSQHFKSRLAGAREGGIQVGRAQRPLVIHRNQFTLLGPIPEANRFWYRHTFPDDAGYLMSPLRDDSVPTSRKLAALFEAIVLTLNPRVKSDLWFPGDRSLY